MFSDGDGGLQIPRMRKSAPIVVAISLVLFWLPAKADWQYTRWNMTRSDVISAARGGAHLIAGKPGDRVWGADLGAEGTYAAAGFRFTSQFYFDSAGRLRVVRLTPDDQRRCAALVENLRGIYGVPVEESGISMMWRDASKGNGVRLTRLSQNECFIAYTPLISTGADGL